MTKAELIEFFKTREYVFPNIDKKTMAEAKKAGQRKMRELDERYKKDADFRAIVDSYSTAGKR